MRLFFFIAIILGFALSLHAQSVRYQEINKMIQEKRYAEAAPQLSEFLFFNPNHPSGNLQMGLMLQEMGKCQEGVHFLRRAVELINQAEVNQNNEYYQAFSRRDNQTGKLGVDIENLKKVVRNKIQECVARNNREDINKQTESARSNPVTFKTEEEKGEAEIVSADVDLNIPRAAIVNENAFALVIGNENYQNEIKVDYAAHDAETFYNYTVTTLGIPAKHVHLLKDATFGQLLGELDWLKNIIAAYRGEAKIYFYYAGHGVPDESTRDAFILPVDGISSNTRTAVRLSEIYASISENTSQTYIFLDACFSGDSRNGMLSTGRGVRIKPKENVLKGNTIVLAASSNDETAHPYPEKSHGLFTYFLLKKLKESNSKVSLEDLAVYIEENVQKISVVNNKPQNPKVNISSDLTDSWRTILIR